MLFVGKENICKNYILNSVDFPNEIEGLSPFIPRFLRVKSIHIELPRFFLFLYCIMRINSTQKADENGFIQLHKAIGKCLSLRSFEWKAIE